MTVVRFDYPTARGWQARGRSGRVTRFFADKLYGPDQAQAKAEEFAAEYLREHPEESAPRDIDRQPRSGNVSGIPGVCLVSCAPRSSGAHAWTFWQAACPGGPDGEHPQWGKRFTCSVHGFERARALAEAFRADWVAARDSGSLPEFWRLHGYGATP